MITILTIFALGVVIWRSIVIAKDNAANDTSLNIIKPYILFMFSLSIIVVAVSLFIPIPYEPGSDIASLQKACILVSHLSYAAIISTIIFLLMTNKKRGEGRHVMWSLIILIIALFFIVAVFFISAEFNRIAYGAYFIWDASTTSHVLLFYCIFLAGILCVVRSFRYHKTPNTKLFLLEPGLLISGIIIRIIGAMIGYSGNSIDAYPWL